ncbi:hypothetical protein BGZ83_005369 [Gryganskiella cystojenkinii]|nr:hypothetical protein BGZ83_005369 [Gryganskiella cystojenkinii]
MSTTASLSLSPSSSSRNNYCDHHLRTTNTPTLGPFAKSLSPAPTSVGANPDTSTAADESFLSTTAIKLCDDNNNHNNTLMERNQWSYGRFVRRVVLNFMHAQASRDLFVETLETLSSNHRWYGQDYYALDLHANEKMRDGSRPRLPTDKNKFKTMDLDTLFGHGSGFSNLACLRLRGGFVDNQLLNALTRGMQARQQGHDEQHSSSALSGTAKITPSRLSQVFLGPGSFTDSAIERLIEVAGSSLEVVMITSCVDIGGGSLAKFLTLCPKLRVLGFYRSLTRDEDLFQGLGLDFEEDKRKSETGEVESPTVPRVTIVAPLERLELCAMLKMSSKGVATIVQGVSRTLKHLVLDSRHFHEDFLSEAILSPVLTLAGVGSLQNLVSLCFKDESLHHKHQQQHRLSGTTSHHRGPLGGLPFQRSPWLGDTLTDIWIAHGGGSGMSDFAHSRLSSMDHSRASIASIQSPSQGARDRFLSSFRCRGKALFDKICRRHTLTNTATLTSLDNGEDDEEEPYESLLERCSVQQETMFKVIGGLSRLRTFLVLCKDMIVESEAYQQRERSKARVIETNCDGGTVVEAPLAFPNEAAPLKKGTVDEAAARASVVNDDTSLTTASIMNIVRWMLILSAIMIWMVVVVNRNNADDNTQQS